MSGALGTGSRKNDGKTRYELIEPFAQKQKAQIFTKGAKKYPDPPHNWLRGMLWSKMIASAKRHIAAYEAGEDYDFYPDTCEGCRQGTCDNHTGELHVAQAAWNLDGLTSFYKWYPQGDDRLHNVLPKPKIWLDIDEVLCDWVGGWMELYGFKERPTSWYFDPLILDRFEAMKKDGTINDFYLNLKPKISPADLPFEPHCYITSRPVLTEVTMEWLQKHGFPMRPVYTVATFTSKVDAVKASGADIGVDDSYSNYVQLNAAGCTTFLMDAPHNQRYKVGYRRIKSLKDLPMFK
jgi:hypothetical protein